MDIRLSLVTLMASVSLCASAISVTTTSGNLAASVGENVDATSLEISGELNAADFEFLSKKMTLLTSLDLQNAKVVAYSGAPIMMGKTEYQANAIPAYTFAGSKLQSIVFPDGLQVIGEGAFSSAKLSSITIPASVNEIGMGAFSNCDELVSVTIPATVANLESYTFIDCDKLNSVIVATTELKASTFARCEALNRVTASSLTKIGANAFSGCVGLEEFNFAPTIKVIGNSAFQGSGLKSIDFSASELLDSIGAWAFANCGALTTAVMNDNTSKIGEGAFFDDAMLVSFNMPMSCTVLPNYIFKGNVSIDTTNMLNHNITSIGNYALIDLNHITSFTLPNSLQYIGDNAFEGWTSLIQLDAEGIEKAVPELGENVWEGVDQSNVSLYVSKDLVEDFKMTDQWKEFKISDRTSVEGIQEDEISNRISASFVGYDLIVKADVEITQVSVFDSSARQFVVDSTKGYEVVINTADWDCPFYIVKVVLADESVATLKVARCI